MAVPKSRISSMRVNFVTLSRCFTTCRIVSEQKCRVVPCTRCKLVKQQKTCLVPYVTCKMVAEEKVHLVPQRICEMEPYCVTYKCCRQVPVCVPVCPPPCPPGTPVGKRMNTAEWFARVNYRAIQESGAVVPAATH